VQRRWRHGAAQYGRWPAPTPSRRHGVGESARDGRGLKLVREDHARNLGKR
jgi:hypothetical protein